MKVTSIIFIVIILLVIYTIVSGGVKENIGSDFFHRGKLADINQHIQKQVALARKRYGMDKDEDKKENFTIEEEKENFAKLSELKDTYKSDLQLNMKDLPLESYDPNRYVISDYSFKALKPVEEKDLDQIQVGMLESQDFAAPIDYTGEKKIADYLEADKYDAGSGDLTNLNDVYKQTEKQKYLGTLEELQVRGGNAALFPRKECNPKGGKDVNGFL